MQPRGAASQPQEYGESAIVANVAAHTSSRRALLKIMPVILSGPQGIYQTYALLDEGSTLTLIDEKIASRIGAVGRKDPLLVCGITSSTTDVTSRRVQLSIKGKGQIASHTICARTYKDLSLSTQSVPRELCQHLEKDVTPYEDARPTILIGQTTSTS